MLRKRASRKGFFSSSQPSSKRQPPPSPAPGRTLILSSTSSAMDLSNIVEEGFVFDFEKHNHIDQLNTREPFFLDFFPPSIPIGVASSPPPLPNETSWLTTLSSEPSLGWGTDDSELEDNLDTFYPMPSEEGLMAKLIKIVYSGRPRMVDLAPKSYSYQRPNLQPLQTSSGHTSRTSSVSARDFTLSPSSRSSDEESKSSPASSISEYSNIAYEPSSEEPRFHRSSYTGVDLKPFKQSHHRNRSSMSSNFYLDDVKESRVRQWNNEDSFF